MAWKLVNHNFYPSKKQDTNGATWVPGLPSPPWPEVSSEIHPASRAGHHGTEGPCWLPHDLGRRREIPQGPVGFYSSSKQNMLGKEMVGTIPITWWDEKMMCFFNVIFRITFLYSPIPVFKSPFLWKSLNPTSIILFRGCFSPIFCHGFVIELDYGKIYRKAHSIWW